MDDGWNVPESTVLESARELVAAGEAGVLATVVDIEGSAYRRPGAKMVLTPDGNVGAITAGCLEDEVQRIARDVIEAGESRVETYDLMDDDDDVWGLGVGCNGIIDVLIEPLDHSYDPALAAHETGEPIGVLTVLSGEYAGERGYYRPADAPTGGSGDGRITGLPDSLADALRNPAAELVEHGGSDTLTVETADGRTEVFVDALVPPPELVVCGTGPDVNAVVEVATRADFRVTVAGFRGANAREERFPSADEVISTSPARLGEVHAFDDRTYAVVMTHNFVDDRIAVDELLGTDVPYVGLLGPRERFEEMLDAFDSEGRTFSDSEFERLYTPVGLDLGGGTPYQIAMAIVSEVLAVHNDRTPRHLKTREGHIHDRIEVEVDD